MPKSDTEVILGPGGSGIKFDVIDDHGPAITIVSRYFNNINIKVPTDKQSLLVLSKLFANAATKDYNKEHHYKAKQLEGDDSGPDGISRQQLMREKT